MLIKYYLNLRGLIESLYSLDGRNVMGRTTATDRGATKVCEHDKAETEYRRRTIELRESRLGIYETLSDRAAFSKCLIVGSSSFDDSSV
jgi:hypothetical protein